MWSLTELENKFLGFRLDGTAANAFLLSARFAEFVFKSVYKWFLLLLTGLYSIWPNYRGYFLYHIRQH